MTNSTGATRVMWHATIKRATFSQKFDQQGAAQTRLQIVCEGDSLSTQDIAKLATLQNEHTVVITIEPAQLSLAWTEGTPAHEVSDQGSRGGGDAGEPPTDGTFDIPG